MNTWRETAKLVEQHFKENPKWKADRMVYLGGLDECYADGCYDAFRYYANLLHNAMNEVTFRVDGAYEPERIKKLSELVNLWVWHTFGFDKTTARHLNKNANISTWFYGPLIYEQLRNKSSGSSTLIDLDPLNDRAIGWISWKYRSGWLQWEFNFKSFESWRDAAENGAALLIYPGIEVGMPAKRQYGRPIPSIRLKALRRGLQDYEYLRLLSDQGDRVLADALADSVIHQNPFGGPAIGNTNLWNHDPSFWDRQRINAGKRIHQRRQASAEHR